jgi:catechol-2,3-dioxygenase
MQSLSFNHLALAVKDVTVSVAFYQAVFGLSEIENTASNSTTRWLSLGEGKELHLIPRPEAEIKTHKAIHFAMALDDIDRFILHLKSLEINFYDWPGTADQYNIREDGIKQLYFQDPNGYWIEVNNANGVG